MDIKQRIKMQFKTTPDSISIVPDSNPHSSQNRHIETGDLPSNISTANEFSGDMTQDLMRLIGTAIEDWSKMYNLENLPKKIVFQQALSAMNAMNKIIESTDKEF